MTCRCTRPGCRHRWGWLARQPNPSSLLTEHEREAIRRFVEQLQATLAKPEER